MRIWILTALLVTGYLYTAVVSDPTASPVTGQPLELWALYLNDGTPVPLAALFALALIALAVYMRVQLDKARAGDTGSTS